MRILFISHTNIGDAILSTILLDRMLYEYPDAVVDIACGTKSIDIFKGLPNLGILFPVIKKKRHMHHLDLWRTFSSYDYDYIVDFKGSFLPFFLKGKKVISFSHSNKKIHKAQQISSLFPSSLPVKQKIWLDPAVLEKLSPSIREIKNNYIFIGLGATSNWHLKTWPQRKFAILIEKLMAEKGSENLKFLIFGAQHERDSIADLLDYIPQDCCIDLVGKTSLSEAGVWLKNLDVFVGHDSGLSHFAAALDIPTVALFGPTPYDLYSPVSDKGHLVIAPDRIQVNLPPKTPKRLITDISVESVYEKVLMSLDRLKENKEELLNA